MIDYPLRFTAESEETEDGWKTDLEQLSISMSGLSEFGGDSQHPSPEDLLTASLSSCMNATFQSMAERKELDYGDLTVSCDAELDRDNDGRPMMKKAEVTITVSGYEDGEKVREVFDLTERNCFINNSLETEVATALDLKE